MNWKLRMLKTHYVSDENNYKVTRIKRLMNMSKKTLMLPL